MKCEELENKPFRTQGTMTNNCSMPHLEDLLAEADLAVDEDPVELPELDVGHVSAEGEGSSVPHHNITLRI